MFIIDQKIPVKMGVSIKYYRSIGYSVQETKYGNTLMVDIDKLPYNSNKLVDCLCDDCNTIFARSYQMLNRSNKHLCKECSYTARVKIIDYTGVSRMNSSRVGDKHPRWNPNKDEFKKYCVAVDRISRAQPIQLLENHDKPRGLCGVVGAFQLDHITSKATGYKENIAAEKIGNISNLRFIPWKENRDKWYK